MSKGKSNSFLPGYFAVLGLGALGLGYLAWSASSSADDAQASYQSTKDSLDSMQRGTIFPNAENEAKKKKLVDALASKVKTLVDGVSKFQSPINPAETGESFQKKLVATDTAIKEAAKGRKITLAEKFSIGFDKYADSFASAQAAPKLAAELDAVAFLLNTAMASGVNSIDSFTRAELDIEKAAPPADPTPKPGTRPAAPNPPKPNPQRPAATAKGAPVVEESKVLDRQPMNLVVTGSNIAITQLLSNLANVKPGDSGAHFFTIRMLRVENSMKNGPDKSVTVTMEEKEDPETKITVKRDAKYILGDEKVTLFLDLDLVRFVDPASETAAAKSPTAATPQ